MSPKRSDFILSADIPYIEFRILIRDCLHIEADCWDGSNILFELEVV
jgi:hypothetical protein